MNDFDEIKKKAETNYSHYSDCSDDDWHIETGKAINKVIEPVLAKYDSKDSVILNAGSGGVFYQTLGKLIQLDIVEENIKRFKHHIVASIEKIPLDDNSIDIVICVGSVLNYADADRSLKEFNRILKPNGILILEFERTNSGEFLFNKKHNKESFVQKYEYNNQEHLLMLYNEKFIINKLKRENFAIESKTRFHIMSTLLFRLGWNEQKVHKYIKYDWLLKPFSYGLAHNVIMVLKKP